MARGICNSTGRHPHQYSEELEQQIVDLHNQGISAMKISKIVGKTDGNVRITLKRNGITPIATPNLYENKGATHPRYKQRYLASNGYWINHSTTHPRRNMYNRVMEHILIMEGYLGRSIKPEERIHHIDFNKSNNSINNLYVCKDQAEHRKIHWTLEKLVKDLFAKGAVKFEDGEYKIEENYGKF